MRWIGILGLLFAMVASHGTMAQPPLAGRLVKIAAMPSAFVVPRPVTIWLPPGYDRSHDRYPVIYMHDGQNLFDAKKANFGVEWGMDEAMERLAALGIGQPAIIVGIHSTALRYREYMPQGVYDALPPAYAKLVRDSHGGQPVSDAYLRFIVKELKPHIDRTYRTRPGRSDTAVMGSSMGGLISIYAMGRYPGIFGQAAALSVHWPLVGAQAVDNIPADAPAIVAQAFAAWFGDSRVDPHVNRLYIDHGTATLDAHYPPFARAIEAKLAARGWQSAGIFQSRTFTGTAHDERAWAERVDIPLAFLLARP
ncbi:alpha/beta hydrolase [Sphingobium sp. CCH11-B1]|jgi:predicted alpha/beta superfamily hydrolase|uniref:alpha/beta hydrolase n=1 Tax=Sphingobium sp. CCH11-B1 TaxID=1768781 RepID=UPI00082FBEAC|nr:alpha/beta hydrolase-fold protein [Sphingobium sp. CCH11-B1]